MAIRILVTGSRAWDDVSMIGLALSNTIGDFIDQGHREFIVVHGDCPRGADKMADEWVEALNPLMDADPNMVSEGVMVGVERWPADWHGRGKKAGIERNELMVLLGADVCLAFIKDGSPGATHCARYAEQHGIKTIRFVV